jgi:coenzyme F420-dependent glucose-6-phosphate dehydrogenase
MTSPRYGYKASAEQFAPQQLLDFSIDAEKLGFEIVAISDHFQPWRHHGGHAPNSLVWLGALAERTSDVTLTTSVLTPTLRVQPVVVAHAFATLGCLAPGRVVLGIGSGEAMNETPAIGMAWPKFKERSDRLAESVELIRKLWTEERVTFDGTYYHTDKATIYDRPEQPIPIWIAAGGPKAAALVGRIGDGFICTSGKGEDLYHQLLGAVESGAQAVGRSLDQITKMIEIKVSYDHDADYARDACKPWAALGLTAEEKGGTEDPLEMERLADAAADRAHKRFIVSADPDEVVEKIAWYVDLGFEELIFHLPGDDQERQLNAFAQDVLPRLRSRWN